MLFLSLTVYETHPENNRYVFGKKCVLYSAEYGILNNHRRVRICTCFYNIMISFRDKEAFAHTSERKKNLKSSENITNIQ